MEKQETAGAPASTPTGERHRALVKHVTGRLLLDSDKDGARFALSGEEGNWRLSFENVAADTIREIVRLTDELNLYYFIEYEAGPTPIRKWWLYGMMAAPTITAEPEAGTIALAVDARVEYANDRVIL